MDDLGECWSKICTRIERLLSFVGKLCDWLNFKLYFGTTLYSFCVFYFKRVSVHCRRHSQCFRHTYSNLYQLKYFFVEVLVLNKGFLAGKSSGQVFLFFVRYRVQWTFFLHKRGRSWTWQWWVGREVGRRKGLGERTEGEFHLPKRFQVKSPNWISSLPHLLASFFGFYFLPQHSSRWCFCSLVRPRVLQRGVSSWLWIWKLLPNHEKVRVVVNNRPLSWLMCALLGSVIAANAPNS